MGKEVRYLLDRKGQKSGQDIEHKGCLQDLFEKDLEDGFGLVHEAFSHGSLKKDLSNITLTHTKMQSMVVQGRQNHEDPWIVFVSQSSPVK